MLKYLEQLSVERRVAATKYMIFSSLTKWQYKWPTMKGESKGQSGKLLHRWHIVVLMTQPVCHWNVPIARPLYPRTYWTHIDNSHETQNMASVIPPKRKGREPATYSGQAAVAPPREVTKRKWSCNNWVTCLQLREVNQIFIHHLVWPHASLLQWD